ncbi:DUF6477 family protein [Roseobacteraceae bacterium NS-SX3]
MQDLFSRLAALHRPRLLVRTARIGARDYSRSRDLRRLLGYGRLPKPAAAVMQLLEMEHGLNQERCSGSAGYSLVRHVGVLTALMAEAECLGRPAASAPGTDSGGPLGAAADQMGGHAGPLPVPVT